jgi:hypothetical protein
MSGSCEVENNLLPLSRIESRPLNQHPVAIPAELSRFLLLILFREKLIHRLHGSKKNYLLPVKLAFKRKVSLRMRKQIWMSTQTWQTTHVECMHAVTSSTGTWSSFSARLLICPSARPMSLFLLSRYLVALNARSERSLILNCLMTHLSNGD